MLAAVVVLIVALPAVREIVPPFVAASVPPVVVDKLPALADTLPDVDVTLPEPVMLTWSVPLVPFGKATVPVPLSTNWFFPLPDRSTSWIEEDVVVGTPPTGSSPPVIRPLITCACCVGVKACDVKTGEFPSSTRLFDCAAAICTAICCRANCWNDATEFASDVCARLAVAAACAACAAAVVAAVAVWLVAELDDEPPILAPPKPPAKLRACATAFSCPKLTAARTSKSAPRQKRAWEF